MVVAQWQCRTCVSVRDILKAGCLRQNKREEQTLSGKMVHSVRLGRVVAPVLFRKPWTRPARELTFQSRGSSVLKESGLRSLTCGTTRGSTTTVLLRSAGAQALLIRHIEVFRASLHLWAW